jgi:hypothetical protein
MANFRFLDDTDAQRQLGVDRITFQELIRAKRLRPVATQGTIQFFRGADIAKLRAELAAENDAVVAAASQAEASALASEAGTDAGEQGVLAPKKKGHEPAMRVHVRLTADLKWYDITEGDLQTWFNQLHPDTYERRKANAQLVIERMQRIITLIDDGQARLHPPAEAQPAPPPRKAASKAKSAAKRKKPDPV